MPPPKLTLVVPVYRNEESISELLDAVAELAKSLPEEMEAVFVDDGSPDRSRQLLMDGLQRAPFRSQLVILSRNFGSFAAIRAGLAAGSGECFAVMSADLQEPPATVAEFFAVLRRGDHDVVVGSRNRRDDPWTSRLASAAFWWSYRRLVQRDIPPGGVDVFGCTRTFRDHVLSLPERNSTLVGLIFWLGFRRAEVLYSRQARRHGRSGWSFSRKLRYLLDSAFAFSDLPIRLLSLAGLAGMTVSVLLASVVLATKLAGQVPVPGYTATVLTVMFFGGLNSFGIGILGEYLWRSFENTKHRPEFVVARHEHYGQ
jgi:glycosyltransferase involved in cell wall biosynthesis